MNGWSNLTPYPNYYRNLEFRSTKPWIFLNIISDTETNTKISSLNSNSSMKQGNLWILSYGKSHISIEFWSVRKSRKEGQSRNSITRRDWNQLWANKLKAPSAEISDKVDQTTLRIKVIKAIATTLQGTSINHAKATIIIAVETDTTIPHGTLDVIEYSLTIN